MPLARIVTFHPEYTDALSRQLEKEGYTVEVASPDDNAAVLADLVVDFEICPEEQALPRATEMAEQLHCDVAVEGGFHMKTPSLASASFARESTASSPISPESNDAHLPDLTQQEAALTTSPEIGGGIPPAVNDPVWNEGSSTTQQTISNTPAESLAPPIADGNAEARLLAMDTSSGPVETTSRSLEARTAEILGPAIENTARAMLKGKVLADNAWKSARSLGREYNERLRLHMAEARAGRQRRLLDLEKRRMLAQERALELEAARQAAAVRLQQLLRERSGAAPVQQHEIIAADSAAIGQNGKPGSSKSGFLRTHLMMWLGHRYSPHLEAILTGVAAVIALFALGLAISSFRPRAALSNSLDQPSSTRGVTLQTGGVTVTTGPQANASAVPHPSPLVRGQAAPPLTGSAGPVSDVTVRHFPPKISRNFPVVDDVTIRHFRRQPKPPAAKSPAQTGLRHISDMDN